MRASASALRTPFCDLVGIRFPIVQTGMGWVSGATLSSATSEAGGLGIIAAATMDLDELAGAIVRLKARTDAPYGVNIRCDHPDILARVELLIREKTRLVSFAGQPRRDVVDQLKSAGVVTMPTVGARRHAEKMQSWGVDALIAQGHEGGGHTGPVPTTLLLPSVCDAVDIPVLGAGGFFDGRGLVAALSYGAAGIAMGTRFLLTQESTVPDAVKARYLETGVTGTVVTTAVDGVPQRVIRTDLIRRLEGATGLTRLWRAVRYALAFRKMTGRSLGDLVREGMAMRRSQGLAWSQVAMAANAPMLTRAAMVEGRVDAGILPTGQVTGCIEELPTVAEFIHRMVSEAEDTLARLNP